MFFAFLLGLLDVFLASLAAVGRGDEILDFHVQTFKEQVRRRIADVVLLSSVEELARLRLEVVLVLMLDQINFII